MKVSHSNILFELRMSLPISPPGLKEILIGVLGCQGVAQNDIAESAQWPEHYLSVYFPSRLAANRLREKLRGFQAQGASLSIKRLRKNDWQTKWKKEFKPFILNKSIAVVPIRFRNTYNPRGKMPVYIDTDLAFGTGLHPTTRFMASFIERCRGRYHSFLDVGTGTGILAIIASKSGARVIDAIDISPDAITVAKKNCVRNRCPEIRVWRADGNKVRLKCLYDFVCANILTQELIAMGDQLISLVKPEQYLAVSGISLNSYKVFRAAYQRFPLRCVKVEKKDGWAAILYKKTVK